MSLGSLGLGFGALELNLAILDLNVDVKLLPKLADVAATLPNKVVGKLLGELKIQGETALLLVLLLLGDESLALLG